MSLSTQNRLRHPAQAEPQDGVAVSGRIAQVVRGRACGFIRAADGQEVFFHSSDLLNASFHEIEVSLAVRFTLIRDPVSGARAAAVRIVRREARRGSPKVSQTA
jgi:cold shock CspA family protein